MRDTGNRKLKAARLARGHGSQHALATALNEAAAELGLRGVSIGQRQVRRWESATPPWPHAQHQQLLVHVLGVGMGRLGFTAPWEQDGGEGRSPGPGRPEWSARGGLSPNRSGDAGRSQPDTVAEDFRSVNVAHRRLYWSVSPAHLYPSVVEHVRLGEGLLRVTTGEVRRLVAEAVAESALLAGRMEFFDLRQADQATDTFVRALGAAGEADAQLLGSAILAHSAFVPGWTGDMSSAGERISAARAYARRVGSPTVFSAWLLSVEAECLSRSGDVDGALRSVERAEHALSEVAEEELPEWFDWFSRARLAAFKGNVLLRAGRFSSARHSLDAALDGLGPVDVKQRSVVLADLAAAAIGAGDIPTGCRRAVESLDSLAITWYATGMERVREVRRSLHTHESDEGVRALDDRLYSWENAVSAISS